MKYNSISTKKTFTTYVFLILVIKIIITSVSAQDPSCGVDPNILNVTVPNQKAYIVGFLRAQLNVEQIKWNAYTHIIYVCTSLDPQAPPPFDKAYVNSLIAQKKNTKIIAAIGNSNYGGQWTPGMDYDGFVDKIANYLQTFNGIDGIDIEFPRPECGFTLANTSKFFGAFLKKLRDKFDNKYLISVTFGPNDAKTGGDIKDDNDKPNLNALVDWVNIIDYRLNLATGPGIIEGPTSPFEDTTTNGFSNFKSVVNSWKNSSKLDSFKLVFGVEFSGIIRKVNDVTVLQNGNQNIKAVVDLLDFSGGDKIDSCGVPSNPKFQYMKSISWKSLKGTTERVGGEILKNDCEGIENWYRKFDTSTKSTYLYSNDGSNIYISYEDPQSLQYKVTFLKSADGGKYLGGIMISDISADLDDELLSIVYHIKSNNDLKDPTKTSPNSTSTSTTSSPSSNPSNPPGTEPSNHNNNTDTSDLQNTNKNNPVGTIAGSVIGSVIAIAIVAIIGFLYYRRKKRGGQMSLNKSVNNNNYQNMSVPVSIMDKAVPATPVSRVTALYDFEGKEETDLSFKKGDVIEIIERGDGANDWWVGKLGSKIGEFPGNYVRE